MAEETFTLSVSIIDMIFTRLPFLEKTEKNMTMVKSLIVEVMYELEPCFKTGLYETTEAEWGESNYKVHQRSVIADIVCCYILIIQMLANIGGTAPVDGVGGAVAGKFLKSAKAGSVEVEWEQFDLNKATLAMSGQSLLDRFRKSAINKASSMGCIIDITDEASIMLTMQVADNVMPLRVVNFSSDCGCGGQIPEQG